VRAGADPDGHALESLLPAPDTNVVTLRESIRLFFKDQRRLLAIDQQGGNRALLIRMVIGHSEERLRFRFKIEALCRLPASAHEGIDN
jgi:hypothetical protein